MIDWTYVIANSTWLVGLALVLAAVSFLDYGRLVAGVPGESLLRMSARNPWVLSGGVLFCSGMALTAGSWPERVLWVLALLGMVVWLVTGRRSQVPGSGLENGANSDLHPKGDPVLSTFNPSQVQRQAFQPSAFNSVANWLVRHELLVLALLAPIAVFPFSPVAVFPLLLALPLLWIARRICSGHFVPRTPLDWPITLMLAAVLAGLLTLGTVLSVKPVAVVLLGVGLFYALVYWTSAARWNAGPLERSNARLAWATGGVIVAGTALAVVALFETDWVVKLPFLRRVTSVLPSLLPGLPGVDEGFNPNEVGGALLWVVPLQIALVAWAWTTRASSWTLRLALVGSLAMTGGTLLLTQSRGALIGLALGMALLVWLALPRLRPFIVGSILVAAALLVFVGPQQLAASAFDVFGARVRSALKLRTLESRYEIWSATLHGIEDFSLTGIGVGSYERIMPVQYPLSLLIDDGEKITHAHNHLLHTALEGGFPGLVAYLAVWMVSAALAAAAWRRTKGWRRAAAAGIGASLVAYFGYGVTDVVSPGLGFSIFFWLLLALLVALYVEAHKPRQVNAERETQEAKRETGNLALNAKSEERELVTTGTRDA